MAMNFRGDFMKKLTIFCALLLTASPALAYKRGDWVLSRATGGSTHLYPGVVQSDNGKAVTILFDDGTKETRPAEQVFVYNWRVGSKISCVWKGDGKVYPAVITAMASNGANITVRFPDDGTIQNTLTGACYSN
jgi:hypothetical protein